MATNTRKLIADHVVDLPVPNGIGGYEFVDGSPVPVTPASPLHGELIVEIGRRLANHVIEHDLPGRVLSDAGFVLGLDRDPERMRAPDIASPTAAPASSGRTRPSTQGRSSPASPCRWAICSAEKEPDPAPRRSRDTGR